LAAARVRIAEGASSAVDVTLARNAFDEPVTVSVTGLPAGVSADPLTIATDTGTLMLHVAAGATQGDAALTVTATGGTRSHDAPLSLLAMGPPGTLDRSFSSSGALTNPPVGVGRAMVIQPDGKIVIAGSVRRTTNDLLVVRYLPSGVLDPAFSGGMVIVDSQGFNNIATAVALQPDGKIVVVGAVGAVAGNDSHGLVMRFNTDGSRDPAFGTNGRVQLELNAAGAIQFTGLHGAAVQPDGGIVVAGIVTTATSSDFEAVVARLAPNGGLDNSFGTGEGRIQVPFGPGVDGFAALALQPDGKIVVAGTTAQGSANISMFARLTTAGRLDTSFNTDGAISIDLGDMGASGGDLAFGTSIAFQPDGKLVATGSASSGAGFDACIVRLNGTDGLPDSGFGVSGVKVVSLASGHVDRIVGLALQPDGKFVLGGSVPNAAVSTNFDVVLARFGSSGALDFGFGTGGVVTRELSGVTDASDQPLSIRLDADGRILITGSFSAAAGAEKLLLARYWP
jgi:uncharacterized delta-60 repeat protein